MKTKHHTTALDEFKSLIARKSFRPFRVTLRSGDTFEFVDDKDALYRPDKGWIYWFGGDGPMAFFKPDDIESIEVL